MNTLEFPVSEHNRMGLSLTTVLFSVHDLFRNGFVLTIIYIAWTLASFKRKCLIWTKNNRELSCFSRPWYIICLFLCVCFRRLSVWAVWYSVQDADRRSTYTHRASVSWPNPMVYPRGYICAFLHSNGKVSTPFPGVLQQKH